MHADCVNVTDLGMALQGMALIGLHIEGCTGVSDLAPLAAHRNCLCELHISGCPLVSSLDLAGFVMLTSVTCEDCPLLHDLGDVLAAGCRALAETPRLRW